MKKVLNDLFDYDGLKIYQYDDGFKFSLDSILLAEYVQINNKINSILDLCTGNAVVPLILSTKTKAKITCFEIQKDIYELAKESINYNGLDDNIEVINSSIKDIDKYYKNKKFDIITSNPPYFKVDEQSNVNKNDSLTIARHEVKINLEEVFKIASTHLNDKGKFYIVHRVNRLDEIIILGNNYNLNVKNIELIKTKEDNNPSIVLVKCVKNSKLGIKISNTRNISDLKTYQDMFI